MTGLLNKTVASEEGRISVAVKSITWRWILNTLGIILLILILINIGFAMSIYNYFYSSAKQMLVSTATSNYNQIQLYSTDSTKNINSEIRNMIENYEDRDQIEMMAIDFNGNISYTSSGFSVEGQNRPPDYVQALNSSDGSGYYVGRLATGEKIMAYTQLVVVTNNEFSALRYIISLDTIDQMILQLVLLFIAISGCILILVVISGSFFVKSIVHPVREISSAVRQISAGDMSVRVKRHAGDEIGELCTAINEMADELANTDQIKNEFISSVSHELRTPLTAIQGWSETILSVGMDDRETIKKGMRVITKETERLSGMVEELLDFSKLQGGSLRLEKDKMDLLAELEEAVLIYTERAKRDGKTLIYDEVNMLPVIYGDKNRIRQVFINIIDNALKYSDSGDTVRVGVSVPNEQQVVITVTDTGCGIAKKDLPLVKERFYKANYTRRGSGIGLALATEIVQMHDGTLTIDSVEGEGTIVTIALPIYKGNVDRIIETFDEPSQDF